MNKLMTSTDLLRDLGLKSSDRKWKQGIRVILHQRYGMQRVPGVGTVILKENYEKFLQEVLNKSITR